MKDLGEADVILNIKLNKGENGITLLQSHYVEKVLSVTPLVLWACLAPQFRPK